ncbi:GEVED domain-containing protein [Ichthyenterobacterium magnum]|uniref:Putative secreted protein (Por secretion system target) n=1 Tax=Ichthyenterobacterium magnum TaxID=1230530 RepID=A0A420DER9_9FLAO|nr:GEVED domain-containing protein [Ichthyenterobacterium magnum]RKE90895.1 putative secreted protein (Por secretion system target) [Ichthyenterobacterium magnum]
MNNFAITSCQNLLKCCTNSFVSLIQVKKQLLFFLTFLFLFGSYVNAQYCNSFGDATDGYFTLTRLVQFNTINNPSPNVDNDYSDYTGMSTDVSQSATYELTVNVNTDGDFTVHSFAWIDWNQDGDFNDSGETYDLGFADDNNGNEPVSLVPLSITVPNNAALGSTRMRISTRYNTNPDACDTDFDGEVEDYSLNILENDCANPINESPSCNAFKVIVVLDESGSIDSAQGDVEAAALALANALKDTGAQLAFVEFATSADIPTYGGFTGYNLVNQAYIDGLNHPSTGIVASFGDRSNTTGEFTNWEDALRKAVTLNNTMTADIVLFMTDGNPNRSVNGSGDPTTSGDHVLDAVDEACTLKQSGAHLFALGVGANINTNNLIAVTGPILDDGPGDPTETPLTADYGLISSGDLTACFLDIAQNSCNNDLQLDKTVYAGHDGDGSGCNGLKTIPNPNDSKVTYCFTITNAGQQTISNIDFSDLDINIDENNLLNGPFLTTMTSGQTKTYYYPTTLPVNQIFPFNNTANVTGETPGGAPLSDSSSAEVTESLCNPEATCNSLADVLIESCLATIPSEYDAGNTDAEIADIFSGVTTCGTPGITHLDSNSSGDICASGATITRTYYLTDDGQNIAECPRNFVFNATPLSVSCPTNNVDLPACSTEQEIANAYATWAAGFTVNGGCNADSNLAQLPSLPAFVCGGGLDFSFELSATDDCNTTPLTCSSSFKVAAATPLSVSCPTNNVDLPACSTEQEIANAYATWAAGFTVNGGCNADSNLAQLPSLPAFVCGGGLDFSFELSATDDCNTTPLTCSSSFKVAASTPLSVSDVQSTDVDACLYETQQELDDAFALWLQGFGYIGGCNPQATGLEGLTAPSLCPSDSSTPATQVWINELHYDDDGGDTGEFVEIAGTAGLDLTGYSVEFYNGNGGALYTPTLALTGIIDDEASGFGALSFLRAGIQNGAPDGMALIAPDNSVIEFISYEGSFMATSGNANGMSSTDIGVTEPGSTPEGESLQKTGTGSAGADFAWSGPSAESPGSLNSGQTLEAPSDGGNSVSVTYTVTDDCGSQDDLATFTLIPSPVLEVSCPTGVLLDSSSSEAEILASYNLWKDSFEYTGGCEVDDNIGSIPPLPSYDCGTGVNISFDYIATDRCNPNGVTCSSTFVVPGVTGLTVACPTNVDLPACTSAADILLAYNTWKSGFGVNDGDNPTSNIADIPALPAYECRVDVDLSFTLTAYDACNPNGVSCTSTFKVGAADALALSTKPDDVITDACVNPADEFAAWILALENMTASGGCNADVEYSVDLTTLSVLGYCNTSPQVVTVDIKAVDDCGETLPVTATFTVPAYTNDLALVGDCPTDNEVDGCSTNVEIGIAFDIWRTAVLSSFSASGGCNADVEYITDVDALQAPTQCGAVDQVVSIDVKATDDCGETSVTTCSFTVRAFESTLVLDEVAPESYPSCDYASQIELDAAFQDFLDKFGYTGGCDATEGFESQYLAPDLCTGGTVNVKYTVTDLCETQEELASFEIVPSPVLEVSCPTGVLLDSSSSEAEILASYNLWKDSFEYTGGCEVDDNIGSIPPLPSYDCGTGVNISFDYIATDRCNPNGVTCSSTFVVPGVTGLTVACPTNVDLPACTSAADILLAYNTWKSGFGVNDGDNPTSNIADIPALPAYECRVDVDLSFTLTAYDACNPNGVSCTSTFSYDTDKTAPLIPSAPGSLSICANDAIPAQENLTAFDNCDGEIIVSPTQEIVNLENGYNIVREWTAVDSCGNASDTQTQIIFVNDLPEVEAEAPVCDEIFGTYSVVVNVSEGNVTTDIIEAVATNNNNGTWTISEIPVDTPINIKATTAVGCMSTILVEAPNCICIELDFTYTDVSCYGENDGSIVINYVTPGAIITINGVTYDEFTDSYSYGPGVYTIIAQFKENTDDRCIIERTITIEEPVQVGFDFSYTDITCYGANDGSITVTNLSEGAELTIKLNGLGPNLNGQDLSPGTYIIEATLPDPESETIIANGYQLRAVTPCSKTRIVTISEPAELTCLIDANFNMSDLECVETSETYLTALFNGGNGNVTYLWELFALSNSWSITSDETESIVYFKPGLGTAIFKVTIVDDNGCISECTIQVDSGCKKKSVRTSSSSFFDFSPIDGSNTQAQFKQSSLTVYPNPVRDVLNIKFNHEINAKMNVQVYNLMGRVMYNKDYSDFNGEELKINFSKFPSQLYYVKIVTDNGTVIKKVVLDK